MRILPKRRNHLLLGNNGQHLSYSGVKLAILTGQLSLLSFLMNAGYALFDIYHDIYHSWPLLSLSALLSLVSFVLNRRGAYLYAKLTLGLTSNISIFYFSSIEPIETSLSFLFIICALGAIATLGLQQKRLALLFVLLPIILYVFSAVIDLHLFDRRPSSADYVRVNMIINFFTTFTATILMFYFLLNLNHHSENELRENEKRLHAKNEELVKVNKELDRFVYSASHDLRSPISSVRGLINIAKLDDLAPETRSYLNMMDQQLIGLNKFIEDIVLYSRNTRVLVRIESISLKNLVTDILGSLQFSPGSEKIALEVNIPDELTLQSDATRVRIVLANLLSNAFKYSNHNQQNPFIKITSTKTPTHIDISIQDNGTGIESQYLSKIFDMFFQANDKSEGSGLGLYIVNETLQKIQGTIRVQSELGMGTEFIVTLPLQLNEVLLRSE